MKLRPLFVIAVLCGMLMPSTAFAGSKKKPAPPSSQAPTIAAVTTDSITVDGHKATRTLTINQFTEINVNGRSATVADLKAGMTVNVTLGTDPSKASRINATGK